MTTEYNEQLATLRGVAASELRTAAMHGKLFNNSHTLPTTTDTLTFSTYEPNECMNMPEYYVTVDDEVFVDLPYSNEDGWVTVSLGVESGLWQYLAPNPIYRR